jgi:hypothetical protein
MPWVPAVLPVGLAAMPSAASLLSGLVFLSMLLPAAHNVVPIPTNMQVESHVNSNFLI